MENNFFTYDNLTGMFSEINENIRQGVPLAVFGVPETLRSLIVSVTDGPYLYICADALEAARAADAIKTLSGVEPVLLCAKDEVLTYKKALSMDGVYRRIVALDKILRGDFHVVCDIDAALQLVPANLPRIDVRVGCEIDFEHVSEKLINMGYVRDFAPECQGCFTIRGDVLDIFPVGAQNPVRIDFFGDSVEKIRAYDFDTGERCGEIDHIDILAANDTYVEKNELNAVYERVKYSRNKSGYYKSTGDVTAYERAGQIIDELSSELSTGVSSVSTFLLPVVDNQTTIFDIIPSETKIFYDQCKEIDVRIDSIESEHLERFDTLMKGGETLDFSRFQLISKNEFLQKVKPFYELGMQEIAEDTRFFRPMHTLHVKSTPAPVYFNSEESVVADVQNWLHTGYRIIMFTDGEGRAEGLRNKLSESFIGVDVLPASLNLLNGVCISNERLSHGVILHESKLVLIGSGDLYVKTHSSNRRIQKRRGDIFVSPEIGDYVVHEVHGIGRITGTKKLETRDGTKEYIGVEYRDKDMLYVPVEQMNTLSKYTGGNIPQLSKFGGAEFERTKQNVRKSIKKMSLDLKALYAERSVRHGFVFSENAVMMEEFESQFPYEETPDQLASIVEIKADMCSDKVMDRLLCGDVGFGKTEVALRAVYLCVLNGKQAALMCPSTVLSDQHFNVACQRFEAFGVRVAKINRFVSVREQQQTLKLLKDGRIDFIIGTHRLLSSDVSFFDLGLLVLDEEQRFGVEHKEKIKKLKSYVDCLTLTATPIPRTLHMSLSGIRDISTINTPPSKRLPVQTYVVEESDVLIRDACIRELSRGGQIFILYNRVETISQFTDKIKKTVPEGNVVFCHGRMDKETLERNMENFYLGKANILVTTTIIENGIDLPNANTMIVIDSDRFGVSQLYQLRGRVGRSNRLAYAYLTYKPEKIMTDNATERLKAIMQFTELGSGYKIAMRDLQIRGAGNVLGAEQHGHMDKVGYELYSKLLREELTGEKKVTADLDIRTSAYIPENYVESSAGRMDCYKQIAEITSVDDYRRVCHSMEDNYGEMPDEVFNLILIALLKSFASKFNAKKITVTQKDGGTLEFSSISVLDDGKINDALKKKGDGVTLSMTNGLALMFKPDLTCSKTMISMTKFLQLASGS